MVKRAVQQCNNTFRELRLQPSFTAAAGLPALGEMTTEFPAVIFKKRIAFASAEGHKEEDVYANAEICIVDNTPPTSDKKIPSIVQSLTPVGVCWGVLLVIMALRIHFTSVMSAKLSDQKHLLGEASERSKGEHSSLKAQLDKMVQDYTVLEKNITHLSGENQQLKTKNQQLRTENQHLKTENQQLKTENQQLKTENPQLKTENQQLKAENQLLKTENQQLKATQTMPTLEVMTSRNNTM